MSNVEKYREVIGNIALRHPHPYERQLLGEAIEDLLQRALAEQQRGITEALWERAESVEGVSKHAFEFGVKTGLVTGADIARTYGQTEEG